MRLKKYGHFGTGTSFQNPRSYQNVWYPAFYVYMKCLYQQTALQHTYLANGINILIDKHTQVLKLRDKHPCTQSNVC